MKQMYKKACTLCLYTVQIYHVLRAYLYGSLDFGETLAHIKISGGPKSHWHI